MSLASLLLATVIASAPAEPAALLYVSPSGNDQWSGQLAEPNVAKTDGPVATLARARDLVRQRKQASPPPAGPVVVELVGGTYELPSPVEFQSADSGTAEAPVEYRGRKGQEVRLVGGKIVRSWRPVTDAAVLERLDPHAREHVLQADLKAQGITNYGQMKAGPTWAQSEPGMELFFDDQPMTLARWPNQGFVKMTAVLGPTPVDIRGTKGCKEGIFSYEGDRPRRWVGQPDVMLHGYWFWDWADQRLKVRSIDPEKQTITLEDKPQHHYGFRKGQWYYAYNLLSEIDQPGEWYLDRAKGILYFWPPSSQLGVKNLRATVSLSDGILALKNVAHVAFRGLILECGQGTAVKISGGHHVDVIGCLIRNMGSSAVSANGSDHRILGCDIANTGNGGVVLEGGNRKTLTPGRLLVENCHIRRFGRWNPVYKPAVNVQGVGNRIAHNLFHDAPHMAIAFGGNDHVIEFNEIHSVVYESNDAGVMYAGYNPTMRGHQIRYNYIHHIYGHEARGCVGVYLDDMFCSANIFGNIFYQVPRAAFIGGGRDNTIENNLFVDCKPAVHVDARALGWAAAGVETLKKRLAEMPYHDEPWRSRFPQLLKYLDDEPAVPKGNRIVRNVCWGGRWDEIEKKARPHVVFENNLVDVDPRLVDPAKNDFRLKADSPASKIGFKPIPAEKIGLYASPDRASWPVHHSVRPKPGT